MVAPSVYVGHLSFRVNVHSEEFEEIADAEDLMPFVPPSDEKSRT
jgi:hypothetical protein